MQQHRRLGRAALIMLGCRGQISRVAVGPLGLRGSHWHRTGSRGPLSQAPHDKLPLLQLGSAGAGARIRVEKTSRKRSQYCTRSIPRLVNNALSEANAKNKK